MSTANDAELFTTLPIPSASIETMVAQRAAAMELYTEALNLLEKAEAICNQGHLGALRLQIEAFDGHSHRFKREPATFDCMRKEIDHFAWAYLMNQSGMRTFMDAKARRDWDDQLRDKKAIPEFTADNVEATFRGLHAQRRELFDRGVIECFRQLNWDYKTNQPFAFGKRIIMTQLFSVWKYGKHRSLSSRSESSAKLDDLVRVFSVLDGKPEPDHRQGVGSLLSTAEAVQSRCAEHEYFSIKWFLNGNGHLTFKRPDLVDQMNVILTRHFPGALPDASGR